MLTKVAEGVLVHQSELLQNNTVVVEGTAGLRALGLTTLFAPENSRGPTGAQTYHGGMIHITVTVDQEHLRVIGDVASVLRTKGMHVEQVLGSIGIITGSLPEDRRPDLESAEGVESVDEQQHFQLAPPDSGIQ